jgi:uncharacterized membrane protein YfcA
VTVTVFAAAVQGSVGTGFAILSVPLLALIDSALAPVPQLLLSLPLASSMLWRERGHVDVAGLGWILAGRVPGMLIGVWVLGIATQKTVFIIISGLILGMVLILGTGARIARNSFTEFGAGVASGVAGLVASVGGPPLALLYRDERGPTIRATLAALFTAGLVLSIAARAVTGNISSDDLVVAAVLLVPTLLGVGISSKLLHRIEDRLIRVAILVISAMAAIALLFRSLAL